MKTNIDFAAINERALEHIDAIFERWLPDGKYVGKEYKALNPKRNDAEIGSFSISTETGAWADFAEGDEAKGGDLVSLIAYLEGCSQSDAAKKLDDFLATLDGPTKAPPQAKAKGKKTRIQAWTPIVPVPPDAPAPFNRHPTHGVPSKIWTYKIAESAVAFYVYRFDPLGGGKEILPLTFCQDQTGRKAWRWQGLSEPRPLYNLDQLTTRPDAPVLVCEGEKAADAAAQLFPDHVCVTSSNGAKSASKADWSPLKGRAVFIWPDNDEPGRDHAKAITTLLREMDATARVSIMKPITQTPGRNEAGEPVLEDGFTPPDGWDAADAIEAGWTVDHVRLLGEDTFRPYRPDTAIWIGDYVIRESGVFHLRKDKNGQPYEIWVSSKIVVVALSRDEKSQNWGLMLEFADADGVVHRWCMPVEMLAGGSGYRAQLLGMGLKIAQQGQRDLLAEYLQAAQPAARAISVSKPGWYNGVFVLPNGIIGQTTDILAFQTSDPAGADIFKQSGTLADWQAHIAARCQGNTRLVFAVCAALTGPVLHLLKEECGGFHFVGISSSGKTTTLEVAASVWGSRGFVLTWRQTGNALEAHATRRNDTVVLLDDINQAEPSTVGEVAYMLGNGQGKGRASRTGSGRPVASWLLIYLSTGEKSVGEYIASGNKPVMAGQEVRLVNIPADGGAGLGLFENIHDAASGEAFSIALKKLTDQYYGHAGPSFIQALADGARRENVLNEVRSVVQSFENMYVPRDACGQVKRVGRRFALVAGVGEAAIKEGLLPWPAGEAIHAASVCFGSWIAARGGTSNLESDQAIAQIQHFLELHGGSRFDPWDDFMDRRTINRAGFRRRVDGGTEYYVFPGVFRTDVCRGLNTSEVVKTLVNRGLLRTGSDGKPQKVVRLPGESDSQRMYVLRPEITRAAGDEGEEENAEDTQPQQDPAVTRYSV